jgi:YceI-like domain
MGICDPRICSTPHNIRPSDSRTCCRKPVTAEFTGTATGRFGDTRAGFELRGRINRKDFGLTWNVLAEGGGFVLGDEIGLNFDIQLIRQ